VQGAGFQIRKNPCAVAEFVSWTDNINNSKLDNVATTATLPGTCKTNRNMIPEGNDERLPTHLENYVTEMKKNAKCKRHIRGEDCKRVEATRAHPCTIIDNDDADDGGRRCRFHDDEER
jgi:hypothetical protein